MIECCIELVGPQASKSLQLSIVITVTDCLLGICCRMRFFYTLRRLVVEDHQQRKPIVATIHAPWNQQDPGPCIQSITDLGRARKYVSP